MLRKSDGEQPMVLSKFYRPVSKPQHDACERAALRRLKKGLLRLAVAVLLTASVGCSSLFFYPVEPWAQNPTRIGLAYEDVVLIHPRGERVHGWWLPAAGDAVGAPRGTVYFLHGNAQNISTHIASVSWLPEAGFNVFLIDYRGYGFSDGKATLPNALADIQLGLDWLDASSRLRGKPLIVFGQSLGASMSIEVMAEKTNQSKASCAVFDAAFSGYRDIAGDVMQRSWLLWPLRPVVLPFMPAKSMDPVEHIGAVSIPKLLMHSKEDAVIPFAQGQTLYAAATGDKVFQPLLGDHIAAVRESSVQKRLLEYFYNHCAVSRPLPREPGIQNGVLSVPPIPPKGGSPTTSPAASDPRILQF